MGIIKNLQKKMLPYSEQIKKGLVTYDEAYDKIAENFSLAAWNFFDYTYHIERKVEKYNEIVPEIKQAILEVENAGDAQPDGIAVLYLKTNKDTKNELKKLLDARNNIELAKAVMQLENAKDLNELHKKEFVPNELFDRCMRDDIVEKVKQKNEITLSSKAKEYTRDMLKRLYYYLNRCETAFLSTDDEQIKACFNSNGFLINEDGHPMEPDLFEKMEKVDYPEIV